MNFNKEHGDVQIALTAALSDYKITTNESFMYVVEITLGLAIVRDYGVFFERESFPRFCEGG